MTALYLDRKACQLDLDGKVLAVRTPNESPRFVPAALLERVVLRADAQLTTRTLSGLAQLGVGVVVLGGRRGEQLACLVGAPAADVRRRISQVRRLDDAAFQLAWCRGLIDAKLATQQRLLGQAIIQRPDLRKPLFDAGATLAKLRARLHTCASVDALRGMEGAGAAAYFPAYAALFPATLGFAARNRRPPRDPVNACLSLGYTLLIGAMTQACHRVGLDGAIGYLHRPAPGRPSMACDLVEPWRARVDALVWELFRSQTLRVEDFGREGSGACLLGKAGRARFYQAWHAQTKALDRALRRHALQAANAIGDIAADFVGNDSNEEDP